MTRQRVILVSGAMSEQLDSILESLRLLPHRLQLAASDEALRWLEDGGDPDLLIVVLEEQQLAGFDVIKAYRRAYGDRPVLALSDAFKREHIEGMLENCGVRKIFSMAIRPADLEFYVNEGLFPESKRSRRVPRIPASFVLALSGGQQALEAQVLNLGEDGLFLETQEQLGQGEFLDVSFELASGDERTTIKGRCEVVWSYEKRRQADNAGPYGLGLRFVELDPASRQAIKSFVLTNLLDTTI